MLDVNLADENATLAWGSRLAKHCATPCVIFLEGNLGAGKTTLVRGFLQQLGQQESIKSPSYSLVEPYTLGAYQIFHWDLYRLTDAKQLYYLGWEDYLACPAIFLIEWPNHGHPLLPPADLTCYIRPPLNEKGRQLHICAGTETGQRMIQELQDEL